MYIRRRNAEPIRVKRQNKSKKVPEALFSSSFFQYIQVFLIWVVIMGCDMILDMRFEYAWPCWLLIRSSHDTYKCGGLLLAIFFFAISIVADIIVYIIVPMSWVLFLGSSLVWLQFAFQADRGICLPTVALCAIFLYVEVSVRFRDYARMVVLVTQILKPFASHCIGYPVVTIGFHIKAYVSGKITERNRLRIRQKNQFYFNLVDQALPEEVRRARANYPHGLPNGTPNGYTNGPSQDDEYLERLGLPEADGGCNNTNHNNPPRDRTNTASNGSAPLLTNGGTLPLVSGDQQRASVTSDTRETGGKAGRNSASVADSWCPATANCQSSTGAPPNPSSGMTAYCPSSNGTSSALPSSPSSPQNSQYPSGAGNQSLQIPTSLASLAAESCRVGSSSSSVASATPQSAILATSNSSKNKSKEESVLKLEVENRRLKSEMQSLRSSEVELRSQVQQLNAQERASATEMQRLKQENETLQSRNQSFHARLQEERNKVQAAERRVTEERRSKQALETQLEKEKKARKDEVEAARQAAQVAAAQVASAKNECSDACKQRRREIDQEMKQLRRDMRAKEDLARSLDTELAYLRSQVSEHKDVLSSRDSLRDQQLHLSEKLREENRFKQDLLTAYHEACSEKTRLEQRVQQLECDLVQLRTFMNNFLSGSSSMLPPPSPSPYMGGGTHQHQASGTMSPPLPMLSSSSSSRLFSNPLDPSPPLANVASPFSMGPGGGGATGPSNSFFTPICTPTSTTVGGALSFASSMGLSASPQLVPSPSASTSASSGPGTTGIRVPSRGD